MRGLDPRIPIIRTCPPDRDDRDKRGHDETLRAPYTVSVAAESAVPPAAESAVPAVLPEAAAATIDSGPVRAAAPIETPPGGGLANELAIARFQGRHVAKIAKRLRGES